MEKKKKKRRNKLFWIFVFLISCLSYSIVSCDTKNNQSKKRDEIINPINAETGTIENCNTVWRIGVPIILLNAKGIDSVKCIRNKTIEARVDIRKNENLEIVIFDTITYNNDYQVFFYSSKKCRIVSLNKIHFKPREVNGGFTICSLKSCEFDSKLIFADGGKFYISL